MAEIFKLFGSIMINKDEVTADLKAVEAQAEASAGGMGNAFSKLGGIIKGLAGPAAIGAVTAAIVGMAKTGFENIKQVEDQMHAFRVATGASGEEAEKFAETIRAMHKVNTDSYEDIGAAVTAVRQRFGDLGEQMQPVTQGFMDYAKVTGQDTVKAMDSVSDILARFNMSLDEAGSLMDKMKAATEATGIPIGELQSALDKAGTQFTAMGFSIDESIAMLGAFHKAGVDATAMQRALNSFMNNTAELSEAQEEALRTLGVEMSMIGAVTADTVQKAQAFGIELTEGQLVTGDMARELMSLGVEFDVLNVSVNDQKAALMSMFETLSSGEPTVDQMQAAMKVFGSRAGAEMVQALQSGTVGIEELMATLEASEGTVAQASDAYDKQLGERWELIRRRYLEPFMETIGVKLMDLLEFVLDKIDEWGPYIEAGFAIFQTEIVPILNVFLDVAKNVFGVVGGLIETVVGILTGDWDRALKGAQQIWESVWNGIKAFIEGFDLINVIKGILDGVINYVKSIPKQFVDVGKAIMEGLVEGIKSMASKPVEAVKDAAGKVVNGVKGFFGIKSPSLVFQAIGENLMEGLSLGISISGIKAESAAINVAVSITERFQDAFDEIGKSVEQSMADIGDMLLKGGGDWEKIIVDLLSTVINQILVAAAGAIGIAELVSKAMSQMWNPIGWITIAGLLAALAVIRNNLSKNLAIGGGGGGSGGGGGGGGTGGVSSPGSGGRQVSAITGPTRDLLVDLLTPLANLNAIVAPIQDIRDILDARLPDFGQNLALAGASAGAGGVSVNIDQFIVQAQNTSPQSIATASAREIERLIAEQLAFARRGRGGR